MCVTKSHLVCLKSLQLYLTPGVSTCQPCGASWLLSGLFCWVCTHTGTAKSLLTSASSVTFDWLAHLELNGFFVSRWWFTCHYGDGRMDACPFLLPCNGLLVFRKTVKRQPHPPSVPGIRYGGSCDPTHLSFSLFKRFNRWLYDIVVRCFKRLCGIRQDAVTGSG